MSWWFSVWGKLYISQLGEQQILMHAFFFLIWILTDYNNS